MKMIKVKEVDYSDFLILLRKYNDTFGRNNIQEGFVNFDGYIISMEKYNEYIKLITEAIKGLKRIKPNPKKGIVGKNIQEVRKEAIDKVKRKFFKDLSKV